MQGDGICLGPLVGAAVARWALEQDSAQDLSALTPSRFLKPCGSDHSRSDVL